jgi:hypothetical protein
LRGQEKIKTTKNTKKEEDWETGKREALRDETGLIRGPLMGLDDQAP